jgi:hypothetical protein
MVAPGRVELPTFGLGNRCSIHLSYGAIRSDLPDFTLRVIFSARPCDSESGGRVWAQNSVTEDLEHPQEASAICQQLSVTRNVHWIRTIIELNQFSER